MSRTICPLRQLSSSIFLEFHPRGIPQPNPPTVGNPHQDSAAKLAVYHATSNKGAKIHCYLYITEQGNDEHDDSYVVPTMASNQSQIMTLCTSDERSAFNEVNGPRHKVKATIYRSDYRWSALLVGTQPHAHAHTHTYTHTSSAMLQTVVIRMAIQLAKYYYRLNNRMSRSERRSLLNGQNNVIRL